MKNRNICFKDHHLPFKEYKSIYISYVCVYVFNRILLLFIMWQFKFVLIIWICLGIFNIAHWHSIAEIPGSHVDTRLWNSWWAGTLGGDSGIFPLSPTADAIFYYSFIQSSGNLDTSVQIASTLHYITIHLHYSS